MAETLVQREETCPMCEGREMRSGEGCIAGCRDGKVLWTSANVLRNVKFWMEADARTIERLRTTGLALLTKLDAAMPHIENAVLIATNHHCPYEGEPIGEELEAFRQALACKEGG